MHGACVEALKCTLNLILAPRDHFMEDRKEWIDISRGIAIVLVIIGHSLQSINLISGYDPNPLLDRIIYSFHMPFFFLLSGYLFKQRAKLEKSLSNIFIANFQRLVLPYLGTIIVILLYKFFIGSKVEGYVVNGPYIQHLVISLLYGCGRPVPQFPEMTGAANPFWFLLCLFSANIIFWMIMRLTNGRHFLIQGLIIVVISYTGVLIGDQIYLPWSVDIALASQIFLYVGYKINNKELASKKVHMHLCIIFICLCLSVVDNIMGGISMNDRVYNNFAISASGGISGSILLFYFSYLLSIACNVASFPFFIPLIRKITTSISYIGKEALTIYCMQCLDITYFRWFYFQRSLVLVICTSWVTLSFFKLLYSLILIGLIRQVPFIRSLYYWKEFPIPINGRVLS